MTVNFDSEEALCTAFCDWVRRGGGVRYEPWTIYPETGGFDLLLVDPQGRQLGRAKLRLNAKVLVQALPNKWGSHEEGPDWRGILVPAANGELAALAELHGLVVITADFRYANTRDGGICFHPQLDQAHYVHDAWHDFNPLRRCRLPETVPTVRAGVPCPIQLTPWKEGALKVLAHLEVFGRITAREVRSYGVDPRRFCASDGWLAPDGERGYWLRGKVPAYEVQHPEAYAAALTKARSKLKVAA